MKISSLENCIEALEKVRDAHYSQLDACVVTELDSVIAELKKHCGDGKSEVDVLGISDRVLGLIGKIVLLVSSLQDLMK